jgi:hypothetical protein
MNDSVVVPTLVRPWHPEAGDPPPPDNMHFACRYLLYVGVDHIEKSVWYLRTDTQDLLTVCDEFVTFPP